MDSNCKQKNLKNLKIEENIPGIYINLNFWYKSKKIDNIRFHKMYYNKE